MKPHQPSLIKLLIFLALILAHSVQAEDKTKTGKELSSKANLSYALGFSMAKSMQEFINLVDREQIIAGLRGGLGIDEATLSEAEVQQAMQEWQQLVAAEQQKQQQNQSIVNTKEGEDYLATNGKKKGVIQTESGIQYEILRQGKGKKPKASDTVEVHYRGTFINGDEFDSSYKRQQTASFPLNRVIPGWTEVVQLMPVGSKFRVAIPGKLAYGDNARPPIGPNRTLLFDIELISIK